MGVSGNDLFEASTCNERFLKVPSSDGSIVCSETRDKECCARYDAFLSDATYTALEADAAMNISFWSSSFLPMSELLKAGFQYVYTHGCHAMYWSGSRSLHCGSWLSLAKCFNNGFIS